MINSIANRISDKLFSFYVYFSNLLLGWQIVSFIYLYQSTDSEEISIRLKQWSAFDLYLVGVGILVTLLLYGFHRFFPLIHLQIIRGLPKQMMIQNLILLVMFFNVLAVYLNIYIDVFGLFILIFTAWVLIKWGSVFYNSGMAGWLHPTTHGSFFVSALLIGCALLSIFKLASIDSSTFVYFLLGLLTLDLFIVYARFQFLARSGRTTVQIARRLMGSHIFYFGARIILGIFMPVIFILYMVLMNGGEVRGVEILILIGTTIDRFLFVNSVNMKI